MVNTVVGGRLTGMHHSLYCQIIKHSFLIVLAFVLFFHPFFKKSPIASLGALVPYCAKTLLRLHF